MTSSETALRQELCRVGKSLFDRAYVHGSAGNISARLDDGWLITPTDACLGHLDPARLARIDALGHQTEGDRASKTLALHLAIYAAAPEAGCVLHTHSSHLVALTLEGVCHVDAVLPPITPYFVMKVGPVPLLPYRPPGDPAVAEQLARRIASQAARGQPIRAALLDRLGPVVWQRSPAHASAVLEELEETAKLWRWTRPTPLGRSDIDALSESFGCRWPQD